MLQRLPTVSVLQDVPRLLHLRRAALLAHTHMLARAEQAEEQKGAAEASILAEGLDAELDPAARALVQLNGLPTESTAAEAERAAAEAAPL